MVELDLQDKTVTAIHVTAVSFTGLCVFKKIGKELLYNNSHLYWGSKKRWCDGPPKKEADGTNKF